MFSYIKKLQYPINIKEPGPPRCVHYHQSVRRTVLHLDIESKYGQSMTVLSQKSHLFFNSWRKMRLKIHQI